MTLPTGALDTAPRMYTHEIHATGLTVEVGRGHRAVDGLDLSLGTGTHGLLGPNGAGKTTLIRTLATVLRPTGETSSSSATRSATAVTTASCAAVSAICPRSSATTSGSPSASS